MTAERPDDPARDTDALSIPASLLAHDLGTCLNVLQGYGRLLAAGALGPLPADAKAAVGAIDDATARLARTHDLLLQVPTAPLDPATTIALVPVLRDTWAAAGLHAEPGMTLALEGAAWAGWPIVFGALWVAAAAADVETVDLVCRDGGLLVHPEPWRGGTGDDALALFIARAHAAAAGLVIDEHDKGGWHLRGCSIHTGRGRGRLVPH